MKKITLPSGEYLMVEVPKERKIMLATDGNLYHYRGSGAVTGQRIDIPLGNYTLIGLCSEISEEEAKGIVHEGNKLFAGYMYDYNKKANVAATALLSLASLVRSNGMEVDTTVLLKIK
jgi:hypothetical protein